jgi:hypothetical protein
MTLEEGWYLMSTRDLEKELARVREPTAATRPSNALRLTTEEALAYRDAGNLTDAAGRSLRLVLRIDDPEQLKHLDRKRLLYEPDFHDAPTWRRAGSNPVNVVPVRAARATREEATTWWDDPEIAELETEWRQRGTVAGLRIPGEYRGFVYKTVLALKAAKREITPDAIADSIARWLSPEETERIRRALEQANRE